MICFGRRHGIFVLMPDLLFVLASVEPIEYIIHSFSSSVGKTIFNVKDTWVFRLMSNVLRHDPSIVNTLPTTIPTTLDKLLDTKRSVKTFCDPYQDNVLQGRNKNLASEYWTEKY